MIHLSIALLLFVCVVALLSFAFTPKNVTIDGFFTGSDETGAAPSLWVLVFSQVTTWIFARSLMNAAILGYFYGFAGTLAYATYYLSFLTGYYWIEKIRAGEGGAIQDWLYSQWGSVGTQTYNFIIVLRLLSEVFANLIVVGMIFKAVFPDVDSIVIIAVVGTATISLIYSMLGGLQASLRTDVIQMCIFLAVFLMAFALLILAPGFSFHDVFYARGSHELKDVPGGILLVVAALQVFSYPIHDPVMMDRGFIADIATTKKSFLYAFLISTLCILGFGMFGIQASLSGAAYDNSLLGTWHVMFGSGVFYLLLASLLVSALSTLDSAYASASRLVVEEYGLGKRTVENGRLAMFVFAVLGVALTLVDNKTLFDAVAVTGTAAMYLTPIMVFSLMYGMSVPRWALLVAFATAILGAVAYYFQSQELVIQILGDGHKYGRLLIICIIVLSVGFLVSFIGIDIEKGLVGRRRR